jgi:hypothetical protein
MCVLWLADWKILYKEFLHVWGVSADFVQYLPYYDTHVVLAAIQCHAKGFDVFEYNPCDVAGRVHVYSPVWLAASWTGIGVTDTPWVGTLQVVAFLATAAWVTNAGTATEACVYLAALLSQSFAMAVDRGNFDLLMFIMIVCACYLLNRGGSSRFWAYPAIYGAAILKFYPIVAFGLTLTETPRRFIPVAAAAAVAWALFFLLAWHDLTELWSHIPHAPPLGDAWGGFNAFLAVGHIFARHMPGRGASIENAAKALYYGASLGLAGLSLMFARRLIASGLTIPIGERRGIFFLAGALITLFAFFSTQNPSYRAIWVLLMLPLLIDLRRAPSPLRRLWTAEIALAIVLLWFEFFHLWAWRLTGSHMVEDSVAFFLREPLWWAFITGVMTLLWVAIASAPALRGLLSARRKGPSFAAAAAAD